MAERGASAGSRKSFRLEVVVGVLATLLLVSIAWGVKSVRAPGARTFTTTCSSANVTGTIWVDDASGVFTSITVVDPKARSWDIRWGGYAEEVPDSAMIPTSGADYTGSFVSATQTLGDTDGGTHRTAQVQPDGQSAWCALDMHASLLW